MKIVNYIANLENYGAMSLDCDLVKGTVTSEQKDDALFIKVATIGSIW